MLLVKSLLKTLLSMKFGSTTEQDLNDMDTQINIKNNQLSSVCT